MEDGNRHAVRYQGVTTATIGTDKVGCHPSHRRCEQACSDQRPLHSGSALVAPSAYRGVAVSPRHEGGGRRSTVYVDHTGRVFANDRTDPFVTAKRFPCRNLISQRIYH